MAGITLTKERRQENNFSDITIKVKMGTGEQISTFLMTLKCIASRRDHASKKQ